MEVLGGGGNANAAGAQVPGKTLSEVYDLLVAALDDYFDMDEDGDDTV